MQKNLKISVGEIKNDTQIVEFAGEFDKAGYSDVRNELVELIEKFAGKNLIFDIGALKFINSEGIGHLMEIHTHLSKGGKKLIIVGPNAHVSDVFRAIGLSEIIPIYDNANDFLKKHK